MPSRDTILIIIATTLLLSILPLISKEGESKHGCPNSVYDSPDITYICEVKKVQKN